MFTQKPVEECYNQFQPQSFHAIRFHLCNSLKTTKVQKWKRDEWFPREGEKRQEEVSGGGRKITDPSGDGNIQFDGIIYPCQAIVLQDVIICGNWVKGKWDFSVFILNN